MDVAKLLPAALTAENTEEVKGKEEREGREKSWKEGVIGEGGGGVQRSRRRKEVRRQKRRGEEAVLPKMKEKMEA